MDSNRVMLIITLLLLWWFDNFTCETIVDIMKRTKSAKEMIETFKHDLDMNLQFQLKKLGLGNRREGVGNNTKCYGPLGCLHVGEEWYGLSRPVNVLPEDRHIVNTRFILYTSGTLDKPEFVNSSDPSSIRESSFDPARPTKIIVHGFLDTGFVPWVKDLADGLLDNGDFNVIATDWGGGSAALYSQAAANARLVGLEVAFLIEQLVKRLNASTGDFHIIGHSLGAHIAGYAGERLSDRGVGRLGRISGLDPAEPLFESMPEFVRLDPGDAIFVDAIHSDAKSILMFGYGMKEPVRHLDFYPNGGTDQPGCSLLEIPVTTIDMVDTADTVGRHLVACSHMRAVYLYIESLRTNQSCQMIGMECDSYEDFKQGLCFSCGNERCALLGYRAIEYWEIARNSKRENVKFYLQTGKNPSSFCEYHYMLQLNLAQPKEAERWVQGFLKANLYGEDKEALDLDLSKGRKVVLTHGESRVFVVTSPTRLGSVTSLALSWKYKSTMMNPTTFCMVWFCSDTLFVRSVAVRDLNTTDVVKTSDDDDDKSLRLSHGGDKSFLLTFPSDLGRVGIVNLYWSYDHEIDPLNLVKVCVLLCSDHVFVQNVTLASLRPSSSTTTTNVIRDQPFTHMAEVCGDNSSYGFSDVKSGEWKLFYKECQI